MEQIVVYKNGTLEQAEGAVPREFPLKLTVNGREVVTLIASPHDLRFLVAGFLRLQGFVESLDDFMMLSVCEDFGIANVQVRKALPERLQPVLTSGCGTGVTFTIPEAPEKGKIATVGDGGTFTPANLFAVMDELSRQAKGYRHHGGSHSAAVADGGSILLYAEDIGRHNTIDRLAGEALFRGVDLSGKVLVTSGRVSSEMAAKAALLGISLIASRTSPTDMAVKICRSAGIALVGYLRGGRFTLYAHPERLAMP
jgi:FdhD protein